MASSSNMLAGSAEDLAHRIEANIRTSVPDLVMEQNEVEEMEDADLPGDSVTNLVEVVMRPEGQGAATSSSDPTMWAVELAQRTNALGLDLWQQDFPDPSHHRDYYTNSRDLEESRGTTRDNRETLGNVRDSVGSDKTQLRFFPGEIAHK